MSKSNILIFDEIGFFYGSLEKLERQMAEILSKEFNIFFACGRAEEIDQQEKQKLESFGIKVIPFEYKYKQSREPHKLVLMTPGINELLSKYNIHCVYLSAFAHYQFPINSIPASIPLVLISPFGHYSTNGNVVKSYVSGKENTERIKRRGVKNVEVFFNPLEDFSQEFLYKPEVKEQVVFGRIGRGEDSIFDPVALLAFKKLQENFPNAAKYIVVNPPPKWKEMAESLNIKNMEFRPAITDRKTLSEFYYEIDVLAHARKDGETVGMAIAEAMLAGNPILTHKSHFHNDHFNILDSTYALWCEADDVNKYFENMKWMIEHKEQIRAMGQLARKKALEIFSLKAQAPKIISDFKEACTHYYHNTFFGKTKGYVKLYWENLKAMPFYLGKKLTYIFPGLYKFARKFYYK
jgi:glycosyltransferase involved in cell wall biosynthesis